VLITYLVVLLAVACFFYSFNQGTRSSLVPLVVISAGLISISIFEDSSDGEKLIVILSLAVIFFIGTVLHFLGQEKEG
jgi:uncharacterized membrane protein